MLLRRSPSGPFIETIQQLLGGLGAGAIAEVSTKVLPVGDITFDVAGYADLVEWDQVVTAEDLGKVRWLVALNLALEAGDGLTRVAALLHTQAPGSLVQTAQTWHTGFPHVANVELDQGALDITWGINLASVLAADIRGGAVQWGAGTGHVGLRLYRGGLATQWILAGSATLVRIAGDVPYTLTP